MSLLDPTQADDRAAIAALVQQQRRTPPSALPAPDPAPWGAQLAAFPEWVVRRGHGLAWTPAQEAAWARVAGLLAGELAAQPPVLLQPAPGLAAGACGPLFHDIAALLRDTPRGEDVELDIAVRWWQQARAAGLPVDTDFGECWRAIEWTGLHRHLEQIAALYRARAEGGVAPDEARLTRLFGLVDKVALRYGPLKPLLRLVEPLSGARVTDGYTF